MTYQLEALGDERFQTLCQAILLPIYPDLQCLPVGQPDGGRDAFRRRRERQRQGGSYAVFQVKYLKDPSSRETKDVVEKLILTEKPKVERLVQRGATSYHFMTNMQGSSHLDVGSIDAINKVLSDEFKIDCFCWWRDDIIRRIEVSSEIKWSYPEILKATDLIPYLLNLGTDENSIRRQDAIKNYMASQARSDNQLKFKQIDLQKGIIDLFVDVPARLIPAPNVDAIKHAQEWSDIIEEENIYNHRRISFDENDEDHLSAAPGALQSLLNPDFTRKALQLVIEGAPGQGKSTVTQYLCQLYRLTLLGHTYDMSRVNPSHKIQSARIPFRVDLRDYASWLSGRDPFSDDANARLPVGSGTVLECFLAAQVHRSTGSNFSVDDLVAISKHSQITIVLDGFDEVAEITLRNRIVQEVSNAAARLQTSAISAQIIVTSRPAAFANSPGFPREEWVHLQILPLSKKAIDSYADKWLIGRAAEPRERKEILSVLQEKLGQPHVRDLARNPMQLAILLALISVQGASLPDKRTALYDKYIDIFLNRESEKSVIVRDNRDILVQIHRYLAWLLHSEAEASGSGNISETKLREVIRKFLEQNGHSSDLVDQLFSGMVERVVALVSRVQGTFEFEVQPLREYFAARHLYDTAPYAPPGSARRGTLPERFDAICRNFYWLNVTRFYAGCYSTGELSSLIDGIDELASSDGFKNLSYPAQLCVTLLSDYVFSQTPRLSLKMMNVCLEDNRFALLLSYYHSQRSSGALIIPNGSARDAFVQKCWGLLFESRCFDLRYAVSSAIGQNSTWDQIYSGWRSRENTTDDRVKWMRIGVALGVYERISIQQAMDLYSSYGKDIIRFAVRHDRIDIIESDVKFWSLALDVIFDNDGFSRISTKKPESRRRKLIHHLSRILSGYLSADIFRDRRDWTLRRALDHTHLYSPDDIDVGDSTSLESVDLVEEGVLKAISTLQESTLETLSKSLIPWKEFLSLCESAWGERWAFFRGAISAVQMLAEDAPELSHPVLTGCAALDRALMARANRDDVNWWKAALADGMKGGSLKVRCLLLAVYNWMSDADILALSGIISEAADSLSDDDWYLVHTAIESTHRMRGLSNKEAIDLSKAPHKMSIRLVSLLMDRSSEKTKAKLFSKYLTDDVFLDKSVLGQIIEYSVESVTRDRRRWNKFLPAIRNAYRDDAIFNIYLHHRDPLRFSAGIAEKICGDPRAYPLELVAGAEAVLAAAVGADAIPVAEVAEREGWFEEA